MHPDAHDALQKCLQYISCLSMSSLLWHIIDLSFYHVYCFPHDSPTTTKHWEAELAALKSNNAKLTAALLESTANVKQWKQQLAAYQEEAERLHKRVRIRTALSSQDRTIH